MDDIDRIRLKQQSLSLLEREDNAPPHNPESLYIGCIRAPLNSVTELGLPAGSALIHRVLDGEVYGIADGQAIDSSEAASIEFAVKAKGVKRIITSMYDFTGKKDKSTLLGRRDKLRSYDFVNEKVKSGELEIVGWSINPALRLVSQLDFAREKFDILPPPKLKPELLSVVKPKLKSVSRPKVYYRGCIDARLDPFSDNGLPEGTLLDRGIAAYMAGVDEGGRPYRPNEAKNLRFAIESGVQHIIISGHTCCGGMDACIHGVDKNKLPYIHNYLQSIAPLRFEILQRISNPEEARAALEMAVVRYSLIKIYEDYDFVREAVDSGKVRLNGWVLKTGSKEILELDLDPDLQNIKTAEFKPMGRSRAIESRR